MSGLRHVLKTRSYRERSQPNARQHLGLLEKKKDYVLRARDFHKKEDAINKLKEKAAFKNPDEYYFGMAKSKTVDGVHQKRPRDEVLTADDIQGFKREDSNYLMAMQTAEARVRADAPQHSTEPRGDGRRACARAWP
jgi:U3 small nucleolar RNA-associated protein 11